MTLTTERLSKASVTEQELSEDQRALLNQVYTMLDIFEQACRPYHEKAREARQILRLDDPYQDEPGAKRKTLQLQTLKSTFNNFVADQMQNMPEPRILPETNDNEQAAMDLQDTVRYVIYDGNNYEMIHRRRAEDLYAVGTAVTQVVWDEDANWGKGDIAIIRWPLEAFLWDPYAENIQDARALIKVSWHPLSWFEEHYPDQAPYVNAEDDTHNRVGDMTQQLGNVRSGSDECRAMLLEYWYRTFDAKKNRYAINVAYCAGGALLVERKNVFAHGMYPFIVDVHSTIEGAPVGDGMVMELAPMMRYINRYASYIDTNLRMSSKGRLLVRRNSGIDKKALADWSQDIIECNAVEANKDWGWLQNQPFNGLALQQMVQMQNDLKQDSGANQFTRGETTGGIVSGKAIASLQEAGGKITGLRTDTLNIGFREMVKQIIWLIAEFYTEDRVRLITGRSGEKRQVDMSAKHFFGDAYSKIKSASMPPPYTVQVEINKRDPVRVEAMNQMYMQAYTMAAQAQQYFPLSALFQLLNIDGKDRLLPIIRENEQHQQMLQQLQQQNEQLVEQLAQKQKENDNLRMVSTQMTNAMANVGAAQGGGYAQQQPGRPMKVAQAGGGADTQAALIAQAREQIAGETAM